VNLRRTLALGTVGLAASGVLGACGFNYATDRVNSITAAANYRDGTVDILNAAIVSRKPDSGTFVAGFANTDQAKTISLTDISGDGTTVGDVTVQPLAIKANGYLNLTAQGGIPLTGTFSAGQYVTLTFTYDDGESASLDVPVVDDSGQWQGLDHSTPSATATTSAPTSVPTTTPSGTPSAGASPSS
jgi:hypothetical protein